MSEVGERLQDPRDRAAIEAVRSSIESFSVCRKDGKTPSQRALEASRSTRIDLGGNYSPKSLDALFYHFAEGHYPARFLIDNVRSPQSVSFDNGLRFGHAAIAENMGSHLREYWEWMVVDGLARMRAEGDTGGRDSRMAYVAGAAFNDLELHEDALRLISSNDMFLQGVGVLARVGIAAQENVAQYGKKECRRAAEGRCRPISDRYARFRSHRKIESTVLRLADSSEPRVWSTDRIFEGI